MTKKYKNIFSWVSFASKILKIIEIKQKEGPEKNSKTIFLNLKIDDIILNTKNNSYLWNLIKNALENPDKKYEVISSSYITKEDLPLFKKLFKVENLIGAKKFFDSHLNKIIEKEVKELKNEFQNKIIEKEVKELKNEFQKQNKSFNIEFSSLKKNFKNFKKIAQKNDLKIKEELYQNIFNNKGNKPSFGDFFKVPTKIRKNIFNQQSTNLQDTRGMNSKNFFKKIKGFFKMLGLAIKDIFSKDFLKLLYTRIKNFFLIIKNIFISIKRISVLRKNFKWSDIINVQRNFNRGAFIDITKLLLIINNLDKDQNVLLCDFDAKNQNIAIASDSNNFVKMSFLSHVDDSFVNDLNKFKELKKDEKKNAKEITSLIIEYSSGKKNIYAFSHAALLYCPIVMKKAYMIILDFVIKNSGWMKSRYIGVECIIYQMVKFTMNKDFHSNEDIKKYFDEISCNQLAEDFDEFVTNNIEYTFPNFDQIKALFERHINEKNQKFHLLDNNQNIIIGDLGGSWSDDKLNSKLNIIEQINNFGKRDGVRDKKTNNFVLDTVSIKENNQGSKFCFRYS